MSNTVRKIIAVICGLLLAAGIVCCVYTKDNQLIGSVVLFALLYGAYLIVLSKKLKQPEDSSKKTPLRRK